MPFNAEQTLEQARIMQHWAKGGKVKFRRYDHAGWDIATCAADGVTMSWDFARYEYQIVRETVTIKAIAIVFSTGTVETWADTTLARESAANRGGVCVPLTGSYERDVF